MRIVYCHNYYQNRGGEDISFESDVQLLGERGHDVITFTRDNCNIPKRSYIRAACHALWNSAACNEIAELIRKTKPDILHCNNLFPQISISVYRAAREAGVPIVQALRNYRSFCANSFFYRDGKICTDCLTKGCSVRAIRHRCYRESVAASATVVAMQALQRQLRMQAKYVDAYFTPTEFARDIHIQGGYRPEDVFVRSNFLLPDLGPGTGQGGFAIFVGRLSQEKGVSTLINAWQSRKDTVAPPLPPLRIIGTGPEEQVLRDAANQNASIQFLGAIGHIDVLKMLGDAAFLVMPSEWYETFGRTIAESFSRGTPVITSKLGAMAELVSHESNGLLFKPGSATSLRHAVDSLNRLPAEEQTRYRQASRDTYLDRFTPSRSYEQLMAIYAAAAERSKSRLAAIGSLAQNRRRCPVASYVRPNQSLEQ